MVAVATGHGSLDGEVSGRRRIEAEIWRTCGNPVAKSVNVTCAEKGRYVSVKLFSLCSDNKPDNLSDVSTERNFCARRVISDPPRERPSCGGGSCVMARLPAAQHRARAGSPLCGSGAGDFDARRDRPSPGRRLFLIFGGGRASIWNPRTLRWEEDRSVPRVPRQAWHTADQLADGRIAMIGGLSMDGPAHGQANALVLTLIWTPKTGAWDAGPSLLKARVAHASVVLPSSEILVIGGSMSAYDGRAFAPFLADVEAFNSIPLHNANRWPSRAPTTRRVCYPDWACHGDRGDGERRQTARLR